MMYDQRTCKWIEHGLFYLPEAQEENKQHVDEVFSAAEVRIPHMRAAERHSLLAGSKAK